MSIKKNAFANFAGQAYVVVIGIVMLPIYFEFLGAEAFGLVGVFALLHSWLTLLTGGVAPTLARQVAFYRGKGELGGREFREMLRSLELIVLVMGLITSLLIWLGSDWLATYWLGVQELALSDVAYCIALMGAMVGLRWGIALYSSGINGLELQVWLNGFNVSIATLRFGVAYVLLRWISQDVVHYFEFQVAVTLLELGIIAWKFYARQPAGANQHDPGLAFSWEAVRSVAPFLFGITYTAMLWVFMTQSDKLILSHVLSLEDYGYFAVVIIIANGVLRFSQPINQAVLPRLTLLHSQSNDTAMLALYRTATQFLAVIVFSVAGVVAVYAQPLIFALTGNQAAAEWGAPVLTWFALGNGILVVGGMQYTLQFTHGRLRMHVVNTTVSAAVQVPILAFFAFNYGAVAVAIAWFCIRLITFLIWPAIVHHKFAPGLHWKWLGVDVFLPLLGTAFGVGLMNWWFVSTKMSIAWGSRIQILGVLILLGLGALAASALAASEVRIKVKWIFMKFTRSLLNAEISKKN